MRDGSSPDDRAIRDALARVLVSPGFARNERLSRFLRLLVEWHLGGRDDEIKESLIGVEVFNRKAGYDPKLDSIVRTEATRLRARLTEYYASDGRDAPILINIPKGGYIPEFRSKAAAMPVPPSARTSRRTRIVVLACAPVVIAGAMWWARHGVHDPIRVAVLPLENVGDDPGNEYFADALTGELISNLSIIEGLVVRSRTSSFSFKGKAPSLREAGKLLDVDYILEGSVDRTPNNVRIRAQLVRVKDDVPQWSARFDRALTDILAVQDEISYGIVNSLRLQLGQGRRKYETSAEAYDLYLRARAMSRQPGGAMFESIPGFEQSIAKDPGFAPAYAALASMLALRSIQFAFDHPEDELQRIQVNSDKAIQLDPLLAEAHDARALMYARQGRWEEARKTFEHAITLDPNRSTTYDDMSMWLLLVLGRNAEAVDRLRLARKADPLSDLIRLHLGFALIASGRYDEAATVCTEVTSNDGTRNQCLARASLARGELTKAVAQMETAPNLSDNPQARGLLGHIRAKAGRRAEVEELANASKFPNERALLFAGLGDRERTIQALDAMKVLGAQRLGLSLNNPEFAFVREDPRVHTLRASVGLPN